MSMRNASPAILPFTTPLPPALPIDVQRFAYGHFVDSAGLHGHRFNEIVLFESAGDVHRVGEVEALANVGTVDALGEGQIHKVELTTTSGGWMLLFPDRVVERTTLPFDVLRWFSRRGNDERGRCTLSPARRKRLAMYCSTLESAQHESPADLESTKREKTVLALFSAILQELDTGQALGRPAFTVYRHFERLLETIDECYRERVTLAGLADAVGLSRAFLTTDVRERTGRTAMQWLLARRMREARRLLAETELPITQIAHDLGFEDASHFARRFRSTHDTSPHEWREIARARR